MSVKAPARQAMALTAVTFLACLAGCAKPGSPGGGPADEQPPEIMRTAPADGETHVDVASTIDIEFSEEMNRPSVERSLSIVPDLEGLRQTWRGRTLSVDPTASLPESTTVVVEIAASAQDYHSVAAGRPFSFAFSTGAFIDKGIITGAVTSGGDPLARARVWACVGAAGPDSTGLVWPCGYSTSTDENGVFLLRNVRPAATPYTIVAFLDGNSDGRYAPAAETGGVLEGAALVEAQGDSVGDLVIPVGPPARAESGTSGREGAAGTQEPTAPVNEPDDAAGEELQ